MYNSDVIWTVTMHVCVILLFMCVQVGIGTRVILVENAPSMYLSFLLTFRLKRGDDCHKKKEKKNGVIICLFVCVYAFWDARGSGRS